MGEKFKRVYNTVRVTLQLIGKLCKVAGDSLAVIKMVDTVVDQFIEKRKEGELKDVDAITFITEICNLVGDLLPLGGDIVTAVETAHSLVQTYIDNVRELKEETDL